MISASLYRREDTTIQIVDGNYKIRVINRFNSKDCYEVRRDTFITFFNKNYTVSGPLNDLVKISDLKSKISINYLLENGRFVKNLSDLHRRIL